MPNRIYKRFLFLTVIVLLAVIIFIVIINYRLRNDIVTLKNEEKRKQEVLLKVAVDVVGRGMNSWIYDYTYWDEMVKFVSTKDPEWARINIEETLPIAKISAVWVLDTKLNSIYTYNVFHNPSISLLSLTSSEKEQLFNKERILKKDYPHFFFKTKEGVFEARVMPIQPSSDTERKEEPFGYMLAVRLWNKEFLKEFQKITFSEMETLLPGVVKQFENKANNSYATVSSKIELKDMHGVTIAYLFSHYSSKSLQELIESSNQDIIIAIVSILLIVGAIVFALFLWVIRPLEFVSKSLVLGDGSILKPIRKQRTEFGLIANLIHQFFEQRTSLRKEIATRTEVEDELREMKLDLEKKVEERTADYLAAKEKAEEANQLKSVFLTNVSHELRTPLFGILGSAELISVTSEKAQVKRLANLISKSGDRLKETLNKLLDLARLEARGMNLDLQEYCINEILANVTELFSAEAQKKGLLLNLELPTKVVTAEIDLHIFEDIINNLVQNAIKFTFVGEVLVTLDFTENDFTVKVKDTGIGISRENLEVIFDQFRQASEGIGRSYEGTGLGLSLTKKYIELLGGTIVVSSEIKKGSEFAITIPRKTVPASNSSNNMIDDSAKNIHEVENMNEKNGLPVLLVEDDQVTQEIIRLFLNGLFEVDIAINADEAMYKIQKNNYMAVLMDINLGRGRNGIHITKEIRKLPGKSRLPIIAQTAFAMKGDKEEFMNAGCDYYLAKPFSKEDLRNMLHEIHNTSKT